MAKLTTNVLGGVKGRLGNVYFSEYRGQTIIKSLPEPRNDNPTAKQLEGRKKFQIGNSMATLFKPLFHLIKTVNPDINPRKDFFSRVYLAIEEKETAYNIDYSKLEFTRGLLDCPNNFALHSDVDGIKATWNFFDQQESQEEIVICLFDPNFKNPLLFTSKRVTQFAHLTVPSLWKGHLIHGYTFAKNEKGKFSDSRYFGVVY